MDASSLFLFFVFFGNQRICKDTIAGRPERNLARKYEKRKREAMPRIEVQ